MPFIVRIGVNGVLIPVIRGRPQRTLSQEVRHLVCEITVKRRVVVITTLPLSETLRSDVFAILSAKFKSVLTLYPA